MDHDLELDISQDHPHEDFLIQEKEFVPDLLLQPITTQQKFNSQSIITEQNYSQTQKPNQKINQSQDFYNKVQNIHRSPQIVTRNDEANKFRQFLNEKVTELKKSQQLKNPSLQNEQTSKVKPNANVLRKIINKEQSKQKQADKTKIKQSVQKNGNPPPNAQNVNKTIQPNVTSTSAYKDKSTTKNDKKFSNSHSNLAKKGKQQKEKQKVSSNLTGFKRSPEQSSNKKSFELPSIDSSNKPPIPSKKQIPSIRQIVKSNAKNQSKEQDYRKRTPQSKKSFRIKRTSNVLPPNSQKTVEISTKNLDSNKRIQQNKSSIKQSPVVQSKNKKLREDFIRFNEEQKILQGQIFKYHHETKKLIETSMKKFHLSDNTYQKYSVKTNNQVFNLVNQQQLAKSPSKNKDKDTQVKSGSSPLKRYQNQNSSLDQELFKINTHLKNRQKQIKRLQARVQRNHYMQYLKQTPEDIRQETEQNQQQQNVNQLPEHSRDMLNGKFASTYSSVMSQMKNKKWGLKQRITFETHRENDGQKSKVSNFKQKIQTSKVPLLTEQQGDSNNDNKIEVNSRLKNLLLQ